MSNLNKKNLFSETECLSEKMLFDYADNKLTAKEKHEVERHLLHCEFCSDALEGLSLINNRSIIQATVEAINNRVSKNERKSNIGWFDFKMKLAAAAAVLLLVGSVGLMKFYMDKEADKIFVESFEAYPKDVAKVEKTIQENLLPQNLKDEKTSVSKENKLNTESNLQDKKESISKNDQENNLEEVVYNDVISEEQVLQKSTTAEVNITTPSAAPKSKNDETVSNSEPSAQSIVAIPESKKEAAQAKTSKQRSKQPASRAQEEKPAYEKSTEYEGITSETTGAKSLNAKQPEGQMNSTENAKA